MPMSGIIRASGGAVVSGLVGVAGDSRASFAGFITGNGQGCAVAYHNGFFKQLTALAGGALAAYPVTALSGQKTAHLLTVQLPAILAASPRPQVVFDICDVNDLYSGSYTADYVIAQKMQFWRALAEAGIVCVELNSTPYGSSAINYTTARQAEHIKYVKWVNANFSRLFPSHILVDSYSIAAAPDYTLVAGWSYDGVHPNYIYARAIASAVMAAIKNRLIFSNVVTPRSSSPLDNPSGGLSISRNAFSNTAIPGVVGQTSLPGAWSISTSSNCTWAFLLKANPYGPGNQLQCTVTFSAAGNFGILATDTFAAGTRIRPSDMWIPSAVIDVESGQPIVSGMNIRAAVSDPTNVKYSFGGSAYYLDTSGVFAAANLSQELLMGPPMSFSDTINGGGTSITTDAITSCSVQVSVFAKQAGTLVFDIAEPSLWLIPPVSMDLSGVVGNVTCNTMAGRCSVGAGATSIVVTNNLVSASSRISAMVATNDATASIRSIVPAAGSFTINLAAPTGATVINWKIER